MRSPSRRAGAARRAPDADEAEVSTGDGIVFAGRSSVHAVALVCGPARARRAAPHDVKRVLSDLAARTLRRREAA